MLLPLFVDVFAREPFQCREEDLFDKATGKAKYIQRSGSEGSGVGRTSMEIGEVNDSQLEKESYDDRENRTEGRTENEEGGLEAKVVGLQHALPEADRRTEERAARAEACNDKRLPSGGRRDLAELKQNEEANSDNGKGEVEEKDSAHDT